VDYIATDRLSVEKMAQIGEGLNEGARLANLNLVGGETAQLPGLVNGLDLAGTCLGVQEKGKVVTGEKIGPGDVILGVPSSGVHSNGLTLARRVVEKAGGYGERLPDGTTLGAALLTPTKIYREALDACRRAEVHGMCHVTGSGLLNFPRLTRYGFNFTDPLPVHPVFTWLQEKGEIDPVEMYRTFNMGMGFAYVLPEDQAGEVRKLIPGSRVAGEIVKEPGITVKGLTIR
jgi:phosphoribosylformylglycinamidine cyclo-ligase